MFWNAYSKTLEKRPQLWEAQNWLQPHQCPSSYHLVCSPVSGQKQNGCCSLPSYWPDLAPFDFFVSMVEMCWPAKGTWQDVEKQSPGMFSKVAEALGLLYSCRSELHWSGQHSINQEVHYFCFIPLVPEHFDFASYV